MSTAPLWTSDAMARAMRASVQGALPPDVSGISIDSRSIAPGEAYLRSRATFTTATPLWKRP